MKKYLRAAAIIGVVCMLCILVSCSGARADAEYEGNWVSVMGEALGKKIADDDLYGFKLELNSEGKGGVTINGEYQDIEWSNDDTSITIKEDGDEAKGTIGDDIITFENMMNTGVNITFAREGSDAAKPENYLPEADKNMLGTWQSYSVEDVIGDPVDGFTGNELKMEFFADHTVAVYFDGNDFGTDKWSMVSDDWGSVDGKEGDISWDVKEGELKVSYKLDGEYYTFYCIPRR